MGTGMRMRSLLVALTVTIGCNPSHPGSRAVNNVPGPVDMGGVGMQPAPDLRPNVPGDLGKPGTGPGPGEPGGVHDLGVGDMTLPGAPDDHGDGGIAGHLGDGGVFVPPPDMGVQHGPVINGNFTNYAAGIDFRDVSTDEGGGIWGATSGAIYYFVHGATYTYNQGAGLAQGKSTWTDTYWFGSPTAPATENVTFTSVAGGQPGQVAVGNIGYIADRLDVNPSNGSVIDVVGLKVTSTQQSDPTELAAQQVREVASWKVALDLNGTFNGTTYMGGWHGTSAFHGFMQSRTTGICGQGCGDFEEHVHPFSKDGTIVFGGDVHAVTITPEGDVWLGDRRAIYWVPQRSKGPYTDFFQSPLTSIPGQPSDVEYLEPFPGASGGDEWNWAIAVDKSGGLYVASYGNGLVYLTAGSYSPTYYSAADKLPSNTLTGVVVDGSGDVWIGTSNSGVARFNPTSKAWLYYTTTSGLPSNNIRAVWFDKYGSPGAVYFATDNGISVAK
jgi:hypothetical protein